MALASIKNAQREQYIAILESQVAELRMRNGELSEVLRDCNIAVWEAITKLEVKSGTYRANRIEKVAAQASLWAIGALSDDDLRAAVQYLIDYLPEWHRQQKEMQARAKKAAKTREDKNG